MIILNMIVKNEASIIERCLDSLIDFIDAIVVCDTGSTDNTIEVIEQWKERNKIEGIVLSHKWTNFEVNRNLALEACKKWILENSKEINNTYICNIDADDYLVIEDTEKFEESLDTSDADCLHIDMKIENIVYSRPFIFRHNIPSKWKGVVHEHLKYEGTRDRLQGAFIFASRDGARNKDSVKYLRDALILEEELKKDPDNSRNIFYLAQSYRDYGFYKKAEEKYLQRFEIDEYPEERYLSLLEAAKCRMNRNKNDEKCMNLLYKAFCFRPNRLEAPYFILKHYRQKEFYFMGYVMGRLLVNNSSSNDTLFVDKDIHNWKFFDELAVCSYWANDKELFKILSQKVLDNDIPQNVRERVSKDLINFG